MKKCMFLLIMFGWVFFSCNNDDGDDVDQKAVDETRIQEFIAANNLDAMAVGDGLYAVIEEPGTGVNPSTSDWVAVHYEGFLLDGQKFDSSRDRKAISVFSLGGLIPGWRQGIPQFKEGGKGSLIIPSHLAYGNNPPPGIPSNAVLLFDIEVFKAGSDREVVQLFADNQSIDDYLEENNLTAEISSDGIYYFMEREGTGPVPTLADVVTVNYEGFLLNGTKFDSSLDRGTPTSFPLSGVIEGWQKGIPLFNEGGKGTLLIPSNLAYGQNSPSALIPPNSVLIFNIELLKVGE